MMAAGVGWKNACEQPHHSRASRNACRTCCTRKEQSTASGARIGGQPACLLGVPLLANRPPVYIFSTFKQLFYSGEYHFPILLGVVCFIPGSVVILNNRQAGHSACGGQFIPHGFVIFGNIG